MSATLTMVPLAKIRARKGFNPRREFADEQMAELVESVRQHGIITPLTPAPDGDGRFTIIAGERRYRAAKQAKLREVPAQVREADGEALSLAVAENVIRADLNPRSLTVGGASKRLASQSDGGGAHGFRTNHQVRSRRVIGGVGPRRIRRVGRGSRD